MRDARAFESLRGEGESLRAFPAPAPPPELGRAARAA